LYLDAIFILLYSRLMQKEIRTQLKDISDVILGYTFRSSLEKQTIGDVLVLQARNITDSLLIEESHLLRVNLGNNRTNAFAKNNDVVLSSRGSFRSAVIKTNSGAVVASSSVYLLRLKADEVLPEYLAIYLNSDIAQKQIKEKITGVVINSLLRRNVEELEIIIPNLEAQKKIITIYYNNLRYQDLLSKKQLLNSQINKGLINKLINS
jgi:restriction endonuclease S subunit